MDNTINKLGFWACFTAFIATMAFNIVQILQVMGILFFPWDEVFIYTFSLCIVIPFLLGMLALHHATPINKKIWSHAALIFAGIYAVFVTANYVVQLATVIPGRVNGSSNGMEVLQQTPHSMFWDFDAIGYIFMGLATLVAVPVFEKRGFQKRVRYSFLAHALATPLIAFVYFYPKYSDRLLLMAFPWAVTAPAFMLFLALMFRKQAAKLQEQPTAIL